MSRKSTAMLFTKAGRGNQKPRTMLLFGEPIKWVNTAHYLGMTSDTRLTWSSHVDQVRQKAAQRLEMLGSFINRKWTTCVPSGCLLLVVISGSCKCFKPSDFELLPVHLGTLVTGQFMTILEFHSSLTISEPYSKF